MSVTIDNKPVEIELSNSNSSTPTPPSSSPAIDRVTAFHYTVGLLGLLLVIIIFLVPSESAQLTSLIITNPLHISSALVAVVIFTVGAITCNYYSAIFSASTGYLTLSMLFYLGSYLSLPPLIAVVVPLVASIWFETFISKRSLAYKVRTCGMYAICIIAAGYTYRGLGGTPIKGDLDLGLVWPIIVSFTVFQLLNDFIFQLTSTIRDGLFFKPYFNLVKSVYPTYIIMLPGAIVLALLEAQTGPILLIFGAGIVVGVGILLKRFNEAALSERNQLELSRSLNEQLARQNTRQTTLGGSINQTLDSFLALVRDYATNSHEQEAAVVEITATIEELSRTAAQIATSTDKVSSAADKAIDAAERGQNSVTNTIGSINEVQDKVREISTSILELNQKSEQIGDIVTTITQIAGEIRLLALNATIEASGAGPYGRRFAVVAGEVSDLADRSREASAAIRRIISEIRSATNTSVHATEDGLQTMQRSIAIALQSEKANNEIIEMVERTAQTAAAISLATQQQLSASEQVVNSMHDIANMIGENAQRVAGVSVASLELQQVSRELRAEE